MTQQTGRRLSASSGQLQRRRGPENTGRMGLQRWAGACAVLLLRVVAGARAAEGDSTLVDLTIDQYKEIVAGSELWVVSYWEPSCQQCKQLHPLLKEVANDLKAFGIKTGQVDISQEGGKKTVLSHGVNLVPHIKFFSKPPETNPYTKKLHRPGQDLRIVGQPDLNARKMKKFVVDALPSLSKRIKEQELAQTVTESLKQKKGVALLLTEKDKTTPLLKSLAISFQNRLDFLEIQAKDDEDIYTLFGTAESPALFVLDPEQASSAELKSVEEVAKLATEFEGNARDVEELTQFLEKHAPPPVQPSPEAEKKAKAEDRPKDELAAKLLSKGSFSTEVLGGSDAWIVYFKTGDKEDPKWASVVSKCEGALHAGVVDCSKDPEWCEERSAKETPFWVFYYGSKRDGATTSRGFATVVDAYHRVVDSVPDILGRGEASVDAEIRTATEEGKLVILALTRKGTAPLLLKSLGLKLYDLFRIVLISNPSQQLTRQLNDAPVPGIVLMFPAPGKPGNMGWAVYGPTPATPLRYVKVMEFLVQFTARVDPDRSEAIRQILQFGAVRGSAGPAKGKAAEVLEVDTAEAWERACPPGASQLCVVGFMPQDPKEDEARLATLRNVSAVESGPLAFSAVDGSCLLQFSDAFDVQPPKLPTVAVYSPKKKRFATYRGTFDVEGIRDFLQGVLNGRVPTAPMRGDPQVDADTSHCLADGAAEEAVVEEEEDIGDLMKEILADEKRRKKELAEQLKREQAERARLAEEEAAKAKEAAEGKKKKKKKKTKQAKAAADEL